MALMSLVTRAREIAQVPSSIVPQMANATDTDKAEYRCGQSALEVFNKDRPRILVLTLTAASPTYEYSLSANVPGWNPGQYHVALVVYPAGQQAPNVLDRRWWGVYKHPDGSWWLRFEERSPASGTVWVYYHAPHVLTAAQDTVSDEYPGDVQAFCHLWASYILEMAANYYLRLDESSIGADSQDYRSKAEQHQRQAAQMRRVYEAHIGLEPSRSGGFINWDVLATGGIDRMFHRKSWT